MDILILSFQITIQNLRLNSRSSLLPFVVYIQKMSTSHHPHTNGAKEITNRMVFDFLRCNWNRDQCNWNVPLAVAEFDYSYSKAISISVTTFEIDLDWQPKSLLDALSGCTELYVQNVQDLITPLTTALGGAPFSVCPAQVHKAFYNGKQYIPSTYRESDKVLLSR